MPTVLQINSCANWGSTGKIAEQINSKAGERGWKTYIAYGRDYNKSKSTLIHIGDRFSQTIALIASRLFDNDGLSNRIATRRLVKQIRIIKPDIIHLHNLHGYYINYKILFNYLNSTDIPVVWTLHDCWAFTGHCGHFVGANCMKWKTECGQCPLKHNYPATWWLDRSKRNYKLKKELFTVNRNVHIISVSRWLNKEVEQSYLKGLDLRIIYNGIDTKQFKIIPQHKSDTFTILAVSSVWPVSKGLPFFAELSKQLQDNEELVLLGVDETVRKTIPSRIKCIPRTNSVSELVDWYNKADVVLSLSKAESFGLTIVEGFACGTPGVVFDNTALPELISPTTGFVVEGNRVDVLYEKIQEIKKQGKHSFSAACRKRAEDLFNRDEQYTQYLRLYEELISNKA